MLNRISHYKNIILAAFSATVILLVIFAGIFSARHDVRGADGVVSISDGWKDQMSNIRTIEDVHTNPDGPVILERKLISGLDDKDCLCFASYNVDLTVYVGNTPIYSFKSVDNPTGRGYGTAFHEVDLPADLGGRILRIEFDSSDPRFRDSGGYISNIYLGSALSYIHMMFMRKAVSVALSIFIIFFGVILVLISIVVRKNERLPFDIGSLGVAAVILGSWYLIVTDVMQLLTGEVYLARILNRLLILPMGYPLVRFFNSLTNKKRALYPFIELSFTVFAVAALTIMRYVFHIDMMASFTRMLGAYFTVLGAVLFAMFIEDEMYCRANGTPSRIKNYYIGTGLFMICVLTDFILYATRHIIGSDVYGVTSRVGAFILISVVLRQFMIWWTRDRAVIERGRFISRILNAASSERLPDDCIKQELEYTGEQLRAGRVALYEDQSNGQFHGTYTWFNASDDARPADFLFLHQKGFVDDIVKAAEANNGVFVTDDIETYKSVNANIYNIFKGQNVRNIVMSPLTSSGKLTGLLAIVNLPAEMVEEAAEDIGLISFFLSELILKRDEEKRTRIFFYNDPMTGALNRRAFNEFTSAGLDKSSAFGLVLVEISNLEAVSKEKGYEAGDKMAMDTVELMSDIFGHENVFRLVGSRFAAFGFETDEAYFEDDANRLVKQARAKSISLTTGCAFCNNGTSDINTVVKHAAAQMH